MSGFGQKEYKLFFNSPAWRWERALYEHEKRSKAEYDYIASDDLLVAQMVQFLDLWNSSKFSKDRLKVALPYQSKLIDTYTQIYPACLRFCVEAAILAQADDSFVSESMGRDLDPIMFRAYKLLFFDIDEALASGASMWLEKNVLAPASMYSGELRQSGYVWKISALEGGTNKLVKMCMHGKMDDETRKTIKLHAIDEHLRVTASKVSDGGRVAPEIDKQIVASELRSMREAQEKADLAEGLKIDDSRSNVLDNLEKVIALYKGSETLDKIEQSGVEKYRDEDFKS